MNDLQSSLEQQPEGSAAEMTSALFLNMVIQQTNMALMFLGQVPHPESGERVRDLNTARMFIDQLEMLEAKTKGNLDKREQGLLKQSLTALRMAFVEAANQEPAPAEKKEPVGSAAATQPAGAAPEPANSSSGFAAAAEEESHKKFSKKY
jgi:hypothetical protein